jgi:hypothetical protein
MNNCIYFYGEKNDGMHSLLLIITLRNALIIAFF